MRVQRDEKQKAAWKLTRGKPSIIVEHAMDGWAFHFEVRNPTECPEYVKEAMNIILRRAIAIDKAKESSK